MSKRKKKYFNTLLLILSLLILHCQFIISTVRYVSKTGSSTPPYISWATAADSVQKCINICVFGDTIYVANGVYEEQVIMIRGLSLIGTSCDSTMIDTRDMAGSNNFRSVTVRDSCLFSNFKIIVSNFNSSTDEWWGTGIYIYDIEPGNYTSIIENNNIENAYRGIYSSTSNSFISQNIIRYSNRGIELGGVILEIYPKVICNLVIVYNTCIGITFGSTPYIANNIFIALDDLNGAAGGFAGSYSGLNEIYNNLWIIEGGGVMGSSDLSYVFNNVVTGYPSNGILTGNSNEVKNNTIENITGDVFYSNVPAIPIIKYNNIWHTSNEYVNVPTPDSTNISADPMFVNDTSDFHLQKYSLLINAGDPTILDIDGSRSDIGLFGGPYGEIYTYRDLAPKPPKNLTAEYDSGLVKLTWDRNTEADFFRYRIYRDTVANFMYDSTRLIAVTADTFYYDDLPEKYIATNYYYKLTAIDSAGHQSAASEEVKVIITGVPEGPPIVVEEYKLLNNYPNPFNPSTTIPYRLKEAGYVKLYVYDIKGELLKVLVNEHQPAGYYEVKFNPTSEERKRGEFGEGWWTGYNDDIATGIYIYQLLVRGEGNIPVFTGMGKMILLK